MRRKPTGSREGTLAVLAVLSGLALGACGSSQTASTPAVPKPATSRPSTADRGAKSAVAPAGGCAGTQLKLAYAGTEGATGHLEVTLALRNISKGTCTMTGYPAARLLNGSGATLPMRVKRGGGFFPDTLQSPRTVVLKPGARARFGLSFVTNNEYRGDRTCRTAAAVMSLAPGSGARWLRASLRVAPRLTPCGDQLVLSPVYS
jgi:hypothetical protein